MDLSLGSSSAQLERLHPPPPPPPHHCHVSVSSLGDGRGPPHWESPWKPTGAFKDVEERGAEPEVPSDVMLRIGRRIESQPCREDHDDHILLQDQISMAVAVVVMVLGERTVPVVSGSRSLA
ncbi:hypothetical protein D9C73_004511 [Collichthys lucidus]|uniref:Uncharacterized protein n=1 Tax=Collichthys lucidus TaxID=240159 RepID=A0A4V6AMY0_COLLU|nr:hypothetical protein D9C73_004511 [Collichthys lucidus]